MILLLGATGYIGQAFARELRQRQQPFTALRRGAVDYTRFDVLLKYLRDARPAFVVSAAGYTGKPNVDACEIARADTLQGNTLLPQTIAQACAAANIPWGHVSSGCIYSGAKIEHIGNLIAEKDLTRPDLKTLLTKNRAAFHGFTETDEPNFCFRQPPCSFYSGTKALAEEAITGLGQSYIWRLRIPFDEFDNPRNYLSKSSAIPRFMTMSIPSRTAPTSCAPASTCGNGARLSASTMSPIPASSPPAHVVDADQTASPARRFEFWQNDEEFYRVAAKTPRSNCVWMSPNSWPPASKSVPSRRPSRIHCKHWQPET
jgi:dTDP-4-dehydrorhamnose reductase